MLELLSMASLGSLDTKARMLRSACQSKLAQSILLCWGQDRWSWSWNSNWQEAPAWEQERRSFCCAVCCAGGRKVVAGPGNGQRLQLGTLAQIV